MKKISEKVLKAVAKSAYKTAEQSANSACVFFLHQPKLPKQVKGLRKF